MKKDETTKKTALRSARSAMDETTLENITGAAYPAYEQEGRPDEHWHLAEAQVRATYDLYSCQG